MMIRVNYIVNRIFTSRTYILSSDSSDIVWLIDCGDTDKVLKFIGNKQVEGVLLTHTHSDHIYGLEALQRVFPEVKLVTNEYGYNALTSPKLNISKYHSEFDDIVLKDCSHVELVDEGDKIKVLGDSVEVYATPGHDPSCLCYKVGELFFSGDSYIPGVKVFTGFPYSNKVKAKESLDRILCLSKGLTVYPGHEYSLEKSD